MRYIPIPPEPSILTESPDPTYQLCLSHLLKVNPRYARKYYLLSENGHKVILDNSAHELSMGEFGADLLRSIDEVNPYELCLPDRLFFGDDTVELSEKMVNILDGRGMRPKSLMGIPQGRTFDEWLHCLDRLCTLPISTVGVSKDYEVWPGNLLPLVSLIPAHLNIHLLGWTRNLRIPVELEQRFPGRIRSIDSAKPYVYACYLMDADPCQFKSPQYPHRVPNYFTYEFSSEERVVASQNVKAFRTAIRDDYDL